ncbi:uncharacterized protein LOC143290345 [Babylonia areolata]|uniref:uncharacterized protein LOC143290345 n=1 Tax=Babylonia areolata TaxID=304850 RepID=UPI003FD14C99
MWSVCLECSEHQAYKVCPRGKVCAVQIMDISTKTIKFPVCVHQFQLKVRSPVCKQAPSPGRCGAQFRRWYFNVHMAACSWFTYSGCGGNDNNFRSREECERICVVGIEEDDDVAFDAMSTRQSVPEKLRHLDPRHPDSQTPDASEPSKGQDTTSGNMDLGHGVSENAPHYRSDETVPNESLRPQREEQQQ